MYKTVEEIRQLLGQLLTPARYEHSLNVADRARELALRYSSDPQQAYLAGLIHDICKDMPRQRQLEILQEGHLGLDPVTLSQSQLWHGFAGSVYIQAELGITDPDIICAVRYHTSARAGMSRLEQIVYLADLTSRERDHPDAARMRQVTDVSLEDGMCESLLYIIGALVAKRSPISPLTCEAYNEYVR